MVSDLQTEGLPYCSFLASQEERGRQHQNEPSETNLFHGKRFIFLEKNRTACAWSSWIVGKLKMSKIKKRNPWQQPHQSSNEVLPVSSWESDWEFSIEEATVSSPHLIFRLTVFCACCSLMIRGKSDPKTPARIFHLHVTDANPSSRSPQSHPPRGELGLHGICTSWEPCLLVKKLGETLLPERTMEGQAQSGHSRAPWWIPVVWSGWPGLRSLLWENSREASRFF